MADALAEHRKIFTDLYINMVRVGEASGTLDIVLERLADFLESNVRLRSKVTSAMIYPILMAGVGLLIVALMMLLVVPRMVELFEDMGGELPLLTRILIFLSDMATNTWFIGLPLTILAIWWFKRYINTGALVVDSVRLRPTVWTSCALVSVVARTLAIAYFWGSSALSLDIVKTIINVVMAKAIDDSKVAVREGEAWRHRCKSELFHD